MAFETVLFEKGADHVATITINRPQAMNSFNQQMQQEFSEIWDDVRTDDSVHAVVLRAAPGRAFSSGVDVRQARERSAKGDTSYASSIRPETTNVWNDEDPGDHLGPKRKKCWKPVITAVHGICAGGAFYWINESDIIICSTDAQFFDPHVTFGMTAALEPIGATYRMPLGDVIRMTLLGNDERISADTALRLGLVTEIVPLDKLWTRAHEIAALIAAKPTTAIQGSVKAIWESLDQTRTPAINTALKYCQVGNPIGTAQVNRDAVMAAAKVFSVR